MNTQLGSRRSKIDTWFSELARVVTDWSGSTLATTVAFLSVIIWTIGGFWEGFTDSYQLIINTGTTIITFLMVFLIQRTQNKDGLVVQIKLNEILAALKGASSRLINVEDLSEAEVRWIHEQFRRLRDVDSSRHSIEEIIPEAKEEHSGPSERIQEQAACKNRENMPML